MGAFIKNLFVDLRYDLVSNRANLGYVHLVVYYPSVFYIIVHDAFFSVFCALNLFQGLGAQGPFSKGPSKGPGPGTGGPGQGYGPRSIDETGQTASKKTRVKNKPGEGPTVASWYFKGSQVKGEAKRDFSEVVQAGRDSAAEAISENQIPRKYEDTVKKYFGRLEEAGNK